MKKLFITAIALVAFSGVSMAKAGELKVKQKSKAIVLVDNCTDTYHATYISAEANGASTKQAARVAFDAYKACRGIQ